MLSLSKVTKELEVRKQDLDLFLREKELIIAEYSNSLEKLKNINIQDFNNKLRESQDIFSGALLTEELENTGLVKNFKNFLNHEELNSWKEEILSNRIICSVDGSQIYPDKESGFFLGAVQTGWFVNFHDKNKNQIKDIDFKLFIPEIDNFNNLNLNNNLINNTQYETNQEINLERFRRETEKLIEFMQEFSEENKKNIFHKKPVLFLDGSLTASFERDKNRKQKYIKIINSLIETSESTRIPLVAYIDCSLAFNLINSLKIFNSISNKTKLSDASLLKNYLKNWGDRSCIFEYLDKESEYPEVLGKIIFCYIKNSSYKNLPARLEMPNWLFQDKNLLEEIIQAVMAESLVGNGYPYAIEVADSVAVLRAEEKEIFYKILQNKMNFNFNSSQKSMSKLKRRISKVKI